MFLFRTILPQEWRIENQKLDGIAYSRRDGLICIISVAKELDEKEWVHLSVSRKNRYPSWDELIETKDLFIGYNKKAIQILPEKSKHINLHPYCLHMWHCLEGDPLPDFTHGGDTI